MSQTHDFVTVDMRGLKAALVARARDDHVSVSALVRVAVARELGLASDPSLPDDPVEPERDRVRVSIRLTRAQATRLSEACRAAGLPRGAYLSGVIDGVPVLSEGAPWAAHLAALVASNARMSTLSRSVARLVSLLREGAFKDAVDHADAFDTLGNEVRVHLALAARSLRGLRPSAAPTAGRQAPHH